MKFLKLLSFFLFLLLFLEVSGENQTNSSKFFWFSNEKQEENVGYFYEVYSPSDELVGYIFGVVHPLTYEYSKKILSLNPQMNKAFDSATIYLPEVNFLPFINEITEAVNQASETLLAQSNPEQKKIIEENNQLFAKSVYRSFDVELLIKVGNRILNGDKVQILNLESLQDQINYLVNDLVNAPVVKIQKNFFSDLNVAWIKGEDKFLEDLYLSIYDLDLFTSRNIQMAQSIDYVATQVLKPKETFFAFPGALHLYGEKSILELLKSKGYSIKRIGKKP